MGIASYGHVLRYTYKNETDAHKPSRLRRRLSIASSAIIMSLAHCLIGDVSVGLNAIAPLKEKTQIINERRGPASAGYSGLGISGQERWFEV